MHEVDPQPAVPEPADGHSEAGQPGELYLSLNTVRTHTKNVYAKLGVGGRRAAVTRARELGLL